MNEIFKRESSKRIQLCDEFWLLPDGFKGLVLQREVMREVKKVDKDTKKPTGEVENKIHVEQWYYPNLSQTLQKYLELKTLNVGNIKELLDVVLRVEKRITLLN